TYSFDDNFPMDLGVRIGLGPNFKFNSAGMTAPVLGWTSGIFGLWRFI
ncbi:MAG: hypothetical protein JJE21_09860, partial [Spirochaetaceae bacterium]|nr:hypothetical protein [Spirochaetaceae bacterium]